MPLADMRSSVGESELLPRLVTLAMLELDVLFGLGHDCESVGCRIWPSEEATVGRLENLRLR